VVEGGISNTRTAWADRLARIWRLVTVSVWTAVENGDVVGIDEKDR
jgi:hypothetical protein